MTPNQIVKTFNKQFPVGSKCFWRNVGMDGVPYDQVTVKIAAWLEHGNPVAMFEEKRGYCSVGTKFVHYEKGE